MARDSADSLSLDSWLTRATVVAPACHLLACTMFLAGYSYGFGAGVGAFFGPGDLFSLSLSDVLQVYLMGLFLPFAISAKTLLPGYVSPVLALEAVDPAKAADARKRLERGYRINVGGIAIGTLIAAALTALAVHYDEAVPYSLWTLVAVFGVVRVWIGFAAGLPTSPRFDRAGALLLTFFLCAFLVGLEHGQGERREPVSVFSHNMRCGKDVLLRPVGTRFILMHQEGTRVLATEQCKTILVLPWRKAFNDRPGYSLIARWWTEHFSPASPASIATHNVAEAPSATVKR